MSTRRRPPLAVLPVAIAVIQIVGTHFAAMHQQRALPAAALLLLLAGPALLLLRRRAPGPMVVAATAVALAYIAAGFPTGPFALSLVLAVVLALVTGTRWWAWGSAAAFALGFWMLAIEHSMASKSYLVLAWVVVIVLVGELFRAARLRAAERRRAEAERRNHQRDEERLVLARDIHDVVAHSLSMINVQASVALHLAVKDPDPNKLIETLGNIKSGSAQALAEVREVLSVLRHDAPRIPSQRIEQLPALVQSVTSAALTVSYEPPGDTPDWVGERVENTIYRAVQEGLTNIVRYSQATHAVVSVVLDETQARVLIADDGIGAVAADEGNGLRGLRERVAQLGGTVQVGTANLAGARCAGTAITVNIPAPQEDP